MKSTFLPFISLNCFFFVNFGFVSKMFPFFPFSNRRSKVYTLCKFRFHLTFLLFNFFLLFFSDKTKSFYKLGWGRGVRKLKTKNKQNRNYCDCFPCCLVRSKIVLNSRSYKKFARSLTLTCSQTNNNYKSKKTAFFQMFFFVFLWKCVPWCFITILFDSFFTLLLVLALSLARVSQRFIQKTIVRLCVCFLNLCVSVLVFWVCICDLPCICCSIKSLIWYKFHR